MRKLNMYVAMTILLILCVGCQKNNRESDRISLHLSVPEPPGAKFSIAADTFKKELERLTDGEMEVVIYYNSTFGGEREVFEMMGTGSLDMAIQGSGPMGTWLDEMYLFDLPFLFENREHAHAVLDGEVGKELAAKFEEKANVKILGWAENGFVQVTNSRNAVTAAEDVKGMKIRLNENALQMDTWKAYGASPTPMSWSEVFTSLQQNVIDGHSNGYPTIVSSQIYQVQDHITLLEDRYQPGPIAMGVKSFERLSTEHQNAVIEAAHYTVPLAREANAEKAEEAVELMESYGNDLHVADKHSFQQQVSGVYEKWSPVIGEPLIDEVRNYEYD